MSTGKTIDWNEIYNQHAGRLLATCRRYVHDEQLAEDLLHDGFIKAIENVHTYKGHGSFEGWLKQVVLNTVLEYLRSNKKNSFTDIENVNIASENETEINYDDSIRSLINNTPFSQAELLEIIDSLPTHHKTVFNLYVIDNYSHKEISKLLNIEIGTSKSHLSRARKKIQQQLIEKASQMKKDNEHKKRKGLLAIIPLAGVGAKANPIDRLFKDSFADYKLPMPKQQINFASILNQKTPIKIGSKLGMFKSSSNLYWTVGVTGAIIAGTVAYNLLASKEQNKSIPSTKPSIENTNSCIKKKDSISETNRKKLGKETAIISTENNEKEDKLVTISPVKQTENKDESSKKQPTVEANKTDSAKEQVVVKKHVVVRKTIIVDDNTK